MSPRSFSKKFLTAALVLFFAGTRVQAKIVIVDDADNQIIYSSTGWNVGNICTGCFAQPNRSLISEATWHDGTASGAEDLFFTFNFTGTSVEVRYVAVDTVERTFTYTTGTNVSYSIDGDPRGAAVRNPTDRDAFAYNETLFNITGLSNDKHMLRVDLLKPSVLLLDYIRVEDEGGVRTTTTSLPSTTSSAVSATSSANRADNDLGRKLGPIIGVVVAVVIALVLGAVYLIRRRRRLQAPQRGRTPVLETDDYAQPPPSLPPGAKFNPKMPTQGPHEPSGMSQVLQSGRPAWTLGIQPSTLSHTAPYSSSGTGSNPSKASLVETRPTHAPSTPVPSSTTHTTSPSMTSSDTPHSHPRGLRVGEKSSVGVLPSSVQGPTRAGAPPTSSFYTGAVAGRVQVRIPEEPVEEGLMSRHTSIKSVPPPYSPGGAWHDDGAPPLPG